MRTMGYTTYRGERFSVTEDGDSYSLALIGIRSQKIKRLFAVKATENGLSCNGRRCKKGCTHVKIIHELTERPVMSTSPALVIVPTYTSLYEKLRTAVEELEFEATVMQRTLEDFVEKLLLAVREEYRDRTLAEYRHVLENHLSLMSDKRFQCKTCVLQNTCVVGDRQALKCVAYFLYLDYANELEWYGSIPLDIDAIYTVDFPTLLILSIIHSVNFETMGDLNAEGFRQRLLDLNQSSPYVLTA